MTTTPVVKLLGVPLSQPFRSVAWTLLLRKIPFDIQLTVPGATTRIGSLNEAFLSKTKGRAGAVPVLEDGDVAIAESPAILSYLCEKYKWNDLYGSPAAPQKVLIDSYMHWHHTGTRNVAALSRPFLRPELNLQVSNEEREEAMTALESLNNGWLQGEDSFIATRSEPTIADLLAYEEIVQCLLLGTLEPEILDDYPNVQQWVTRMRKLPYHEEVHTALHVLGNLVEPCETPLPKRLAAATKAGVAAMTKAQESFDRGGTTPTSML